MRARWLKPELFTDKKIATMGPIAALVYEALWCMADDGGTVECDADTIKARLFYRWSAVGVPEISGALQHLSAAGCIVRYTVGDDTFATIPTWGKHQQVHKPSKFRHPPLSEGVALVVPEWCGTTEAPLPASPPPRHLDTKTPRHPSSPAKKAGGKKAKPKAVKPAVPAFDFAPFAEAWFAQYDGQIAAEPNVTPLQWLVRKYGHEETLRRWVIYLDENGSQYASAAKLKSGWGQWASPKAARPSATLSGVSGEILAEATTLWARYRAANLLTRWPADEYRRIADDLIAAGHYADIAAFKAELGITQPWTLKDLRNDGIAINEIARRLAEARKAAA